MDQRLDSLAAEDASGPLYVQVAQRLYQAIRRGEFPVGSTLPTEVQLAQLHNVSRQTIREAIDLLRQDGMLSTRKRVGTRVEASAAAPRFRKAFQSVADLLGLAAETEMVVDRRDWITARPALATELGCAPGQRWLRLRCRRRRPGETRPICCADVYVDEEVAPGIADQDLFRTALFQQLEQAAGEPVREIRQDIQASILDAATARRLDAVAGAPALRIIRRYVGRGNRLLEVSVTTLPADRFVYSLTIERQPAPGG